MQGFVQDANVVISFLLQEASTKRMEFSRNTLREGPWLMCI